MLNIQTFDNRAGGNVLYKALTHPLAAEAIAWLYARMRGPVALYDPEGIAAPLLRFIRSLSQGSMCTTSPRSAWTERAT